MVIVFVHVNDVGFQWVECCIDVVRHVLWGSAEAQELFHLQGREDMKLSKKPLTRSSSTLKLRSSVCWYLRLSITLDGDGISLSRNDSSSGVVIPSHRQSNVFNPSLIRPGRIIGRRTNSVMATSCSVFWMVSTAGVAFKWYPSIADQNLDWCAGSWRNDGSFMHASTDCHLCSGIWDFKNSWLWCYSSFL